MKSAPYMPLFVADYLADTGHLGALEHGVYLLLIMHYWRAGALPKDDASLANIARVSGYQWRAVRPKIAAFFRHDWTHGRVEIEIEKSKITREANAKKGSAGGVAKSLKYNNVPVAGAIAELPEKAAPALPLLHTHISSSLRSEDRPPKAVRQKKPDVGDLLLADGVPPQALSDWRTVRKQPITQTVLDGLRREAAAAGMTVPAAVVLAAERGWRGFDAEWVKNQHQHNGKRSNVPKARSLHDATLDLQARLNGHDASRNLSTGLDWGPSADSHRLLPPR